MHRQMMPASDAVACREPNIQKKARRSSAAPPGFFEDDEPEVIEEPYSSSNAPV